MREKKPYLGLGRSLSLDDAPWRYGLDNIGEGVPDTHCDRRKNSQWRVVVSIEVSLSFLIVRGRKLSARGTK